VARSNARSRLRAETGARDERDKAEMDAEAQRLSARYGLGPCTRSWDESGLLTRIVVGILIIVLAVLTGIVSLGVTQPGDRPASSGPYAALALLAVGALMIAIPPRSRRTWLFLFDGGVARVSSRRPRLTVLPWADLETLSFKVVSGYDEDYVAGCTLRGRTGTTLRMDRDGDAGHACPTSYYALASNARYALASAAERELASRHVGALTRLLDSGQPVTFGSLTIDRLGIRSRGSAAHGGRWHVDWRQAHGVSIRLNGQRVTVQPGRQGAKQAVLDGEPNSFLARYAIEHAARLAGVPVSVV
jgi:hypothetical protein